MLLRSAIHLVVHLDCRTFFLLMKTLKLNKSVSIYDEPFPYATYDVTGENQIKADSGCGLWEELTCNDTEKDVVRSLGIKPWFEKEPFFMANGAPVYGKSWMTARRFTIGASDAGKLISMSLAEKNSLITQKLAGLPAEGAYNSNRYIYWGHRLETPILEHTLAAVEKSGYPFMGYTGFIVMPSIGLMASPDLLYFSPSLNGLVNVNAKSTNSAGMNANVPNISGKFYFQMCVETLLTGAKYSIYTLFNVEDRDAVIIRATTDDPLFVQDLTTVINLLRTNWITPLTTHTLANSKLDTLLRRSPEMKSYSHNPPQNPFSDEEAYMDIASW